MAHKEERLAEYVPIYEVLNSNAHSLSTQSKSNRSEAENGELQVARVPNSRSSCGWYWEGTSNPSTTYFHADTPSHRSKWNRPSSNINKANTPLSSPSPKGSLNFLNSQAPHEPRPDPSIHQDLPCRRCQYLPNETVFRTFASLLRLHENSPSKEPPSVGFRCVQLVALPPVYALTFIGLFKLDVSSNLFRLNKESNMMTLNRLKVEEIPDALASFSAS